MTVSHLIIAIFVGKYSKNWSAHRGPGWASAALVSPDLLEFSETTCRNPSSLVHIVVVLHAELWSNVGPGAMGNAL